MSDIWQNENIKATLIFENDTELSPSRLVVYKDTPTVVTQLGFYGEGVLTGDVIPLVVFKITPSLTDGPLADNARVIVKYVNQAGSVLITTEDGLVTFTLYNSGNTQSAIQSAIDAYTTTWTNRSNEIVGLSGWVISCPTLTLADVLETEILIIDNAVIEPDGASIHSLSIKENDAIISGNPLGVLTPNTCNISIFDPQNRLSSSNPDSPFYGYIKQGVKIVLEISYDGTTYVPYGVYYSVNWSTDYSNGYNGQTNISANDALDYVSKLVVPKIPIVLDTTLNDTLQLLFTKLNETSKIVLTLNILDSLTKSMKYGVVYGNTAREFINYAVMWYLGRFTVGRDGEFYIYRIGTDSGNTYTLTDDMVIKLPSDKKTESVIYNRIKLTYKQFGATEIQEIIRSTDISLNSSTVSSGITKFDKLQMGRKILCVTDVYFETPNTIGAQEIVLDNLGYEAGQDNIDVTIHNNATVTVPADLFIDGIMLNEKDISVLSTQTTEEDVSVASILNLNNPLIQTTTEAEAYVESALDIINMFSNTLVLETLLTPACTTGDTVTVELTSGGIIFNGDYTVLAVNTKHGADYVNTITLVKKPGV